MKNIIRFFSALAVGVLLLHPSLRAVAPAELKGVVSNQLFQVLIERPSNLVYTVQKSLDLSNWITISLILGADGFTNSFLPFTDPVDTSNGVSFYRVATSTHTATNDWSNAIFYPEDDFLSPRTTFADDEIRWIKFAITTHEPYRVYFQDSGKYPFHYDYAVARLPQFKEMSHDEFDAVSLHAAAQQVVLGSVLYDPDPEAREVAIQFVGAEPYPKEQIAEWFRIVKAAIIPRDEVSAFYFPAYEQSAVAEANRDYFRGLGMEVASVLRWNNAANVYSSGWALGPLKYFPTDQIATAYTDGRLGPLDILLTDTVPAELPYVSGILSLNPATPNSHVAILAGSYGVPFAFVSTNGLRELALSLVGKDVILSTVSGFGGNEVRLIDASGLSGSLRQEMIEAKAPEPINITPKQRRGAYIVSTDGLTPADIKYFGGKVSNYGFLRRSIPDNSHEALAISFDLWDDFLDQTLSTGKTLREEIAARLGKYTYPPNAAGLAIDLEAVRSLITDSTQFTMDELDQIAAALLGQFDPKQKIRFRSSTNVEDTEAFTGAGLYDSYSGCLADDTDSDDKGPSLCDAAEPKERGVFRAIRKVYASFYNDNAFIERLRHQVDESKIGMAILVHYSTPDDVELANGVATVNCQVFGDNLSYQANMVTQKGAVSVTNPDSSALPETVNLSQFAFGSAFATITQKSSLVPLGATVMEWQNDYLNFGDLFANIAKTYSSYYADRDAFTLDLEYKKITPSQLIVKQVRTIPMPDPNATQTAFLINQPAEWSVFEGEFGDVFSNHNLKSHWILATRDLKMAASNLTTTIFAPVSFEHSFAGQFETVSGNVSTFPRAAHVVGTSDDIFLPISDSWNSDPAEGVRFSLDLILKTGVGPAESPILFLSDMQVNLEADYAKPVWGVDNFGLQGLTSTQFVRLVPLPQRRSSDVPVLRRAEFGKTGTIDIEFYWPKPPGGISAGYTAPLVAWKQTVITGLISSPITLTGYYSQTYRPQHHNFVEDFVFEPRLEEGISSAILAELDALDILQIYVRTGSTDPDSVKVIGKDGLLRSL